MSDAVKGFITTCIGAALGAILNLIGNGLPSDLVGLKKLGIAAGFAAVLAGIPYIMKQLGTGENGQILTNKPKEEVAVEKKS
jgi:hypothetical protein